MTGRRILTIWTTPVAAAVLVAGAHVASAQSVPAQPVEPASSARTEPVQPDEAHAGMGLSGPDRLHIRGFSDIQFLASDQHLAPSTFSIGQLDLFMTSQVADDLSVVGEVVFEANDENVYVLDVERLLLQFSPSDYLDIGVGRYHTSIGFYNSAYHHGTWFQTAVGRPRIFEFEDDDGLLPVHGVGVTMRGRIPSGRLGLQWLAELSNGRSFSGEPVQVVQDDNGTKAFNVGAIARPQWLPGLQAGLSFYHDTVRTPSAARVTQSIVAAHVVYQGGVFEALNEVLFLRHTPDGRDDTSTTSAFYTQISRRFNRLRPYLRYEYTDVPFDDPLFGGFGTTTGPSVGLRYDFRDLAALKIQWDRFTTRSEEAVNTLTVQFAFTF